jgi:uncharacterized protein (DUF1684 family)
VTGAPLTPTSVTDAYRLSIEEAHAARVGRLRSATGWLSLVGKAFLGQGTTTIGSAPDAGARLPDGVPAQVGTLVITGNVVHFTAAAGVDVRCNGEPVTERVLASDRIGKADALVVDGIVLELMERGDALALRIRDTRQVPTPYAGISLYPIDPAWNVHARLEAYAEPRALDLDFEGASGAVADTFLSPGAVVFEHAGAEHRLEAVYEDSSKRRLFILFRDATSGTESYGLGRFVYAPLPDESGHLFVDFNLALLPACAFTIFATCPIPPRENRLGIPVRAGEREYLGPAIGT